MTGSFKERYLAVAGDLVPNLGGDHALPHEDVGVVENRLGIKLPLSLREYLLSIGKLKLNTAHNRLLPLADWFIDDDKLVFMEENQWVVYWGVSASKTVADDPALFQGVNRRHKPIEWFPEQDRTSDFLVLMLHFQAAMGGFDQILSGPVNPNMLGYFESEWSFGGESNGLIAFRRKGEVACFMGSRGAGRLKMFAGAVSEAAFRDLSTTLRELRIEYNVL